MLIVTGYTHKNRRTMIGAIIGALGSTAASMIGASMSKKQAQKAQAERDKQARRLDSWYDRKANEDVLQLSEVQAALNQARELSKNQIQAAKSRSAVMGGGQQEIASAQESANKMLGDVTRSIVATGTARKDAADDKYMAGQDALTADRVAALNQRSANAAQAASSAIQAGMAMVGADAQSHLTSGYGMFESLFKKQRT